MTEKPVTPTRTLALPIWVWVALPIAAIVALVAVFVLSNPAAVLTSDAPPLEDLALERIVLTETGFRVTVFNNGATEVTIAQVAVDDAFWQFTVEPSATLPRLSWATVTIPLRLGGG